MVLEESARGRCGRYGPLEEEGVLDRLRSEAEDVVPVLACKALNGWMAGDQRVGHGFASRVEIKAIVKDVNLK